MYVGIHESAAASLTQFLGPAEAGSLRAILYTTKKKKKTYLILFYCILLLYIYTRICVHFIWIRKKKKKTSRTTLDFRAIRSFWVCRSFERGLENTYKMYE